MASTEEFTNLNSGDAQLPANSGEGPANSSRTKRKRRQKKDTTLTVTLPEEHGHQQQQSPGPDAGETQLSGNAQEASDGTLTIVARAFAAKPKKLRATHDEDAEDHAVEGDSTLWNDDGGCVRIGSLRTARNPVTQRFREPSLEHGYAVFRGVTLRWIKWCSLGAAVAYTAGIFSFLSNDQVEVPTLAVNLVLVVFLIIIAVIGHYLASRFPHLDRFSEKYRYAVRGEICVVAIIALSSFTPALGPTLENLCVEARGYANRGFCYHRIYPWTFVVQVLPVLLLSLRCAFAIPLTILVGALQIVAR